MCAEQIRRFPHFMGVEEENVILNIANLGEDFFLLHNLDVLYMNCTDLKLKSIEEKSLIMPVFLYLITHNEFYSAMSSYLRMHKSRSFRSLRAALDSAFTAYYLLKYPDKVKVYLSKLTEEDNPEWDKIFLNIKRTMKNNIEEFPLAKGLPEIHEFCSIYSHSDALGILHKYSIDEEKSRLEAKYFDYETSIEDYNKWFIYILYAFTEIYLIYWKEIFSKMAGDKLEVFESNIVGYIKIIEMLKAKYSFKEN